MDDIKHMYTFIYFNKIFQFVTVSIWIWIMYWRWFLTHSWQITGKPTINHSWPIHQICCELRHIFVLHGKNASFNLSSYLWSILFMLNRFSTHWWPSFCRRHFQIHFLWKTFCMLWLKFNCFAPTNPIVKLISFLLSKIQIFALPK